MSNTTADKEPWPFPKSGENGDCPAGEPEQIDPAEASLAEENLRHDQKVTRAIDSELPNKTA